MTKRNTTRARGAKQHPRATDTTPSPTPPPRRKPEPRPAISLRLELNVVRSAAEAARILCDAVRDSQAATAHDDRVAPACASAVLVLVEERLRFLDGILAEEANQHLFHAPHNQARISWIREVGLRTDDIMIALDGDAVRDRPKK